MFGLDRFSVLFDSDHSLFKYKTDKVMRRLLVIFIFIQGTFNNLDSDHSMNLIYFVFVCLKSSSFGDNPLPWPYNG